MRTDPNRSTLIGRAAIFIGAAGCAVLCLRTIRLVGVGLALVIKKSGDDPNTRREKA